MIGPLATHAYSESGTLSENGDQYWDKNEYDFYEYRVTATTTLKLSLYIDADVAVYILIFEGHNAGDIEDAVGSIVDENPNSDIYNASATNTGYLTVSYTANSRNDVSVAVFSYSTYTFSNVHYTLSSNIKEGIPLLGNGGGGSSGSTTSDEPIGFGGEVLFFSLLFIPIMIIVPLWGDHRDYLSATMAVGIYLFSIGLTYFFPDDGSSFSLFYIPLFLYYQRRVSRRIFETRYCNKHDYRDFKTPTYMKILWGVVLLFDIGLLTELVRYYYDKPMIVIILLAGLIVSQFLIYIIMTRFVLRGSSRGRSRTRMTRSTYSSQTSYQPPKYPERFDQSGPYINPASTSSPARQSISQDQQSSSVKFCPSCGHRATNVFCSNCGTKL